MNSNSKPVWVELELTHPNCWTLDVTETAEMQLLSKGVHRPTEQKVHGYFIAFSKSKNKIDDSIDRIKQSQYTEQVHVFDTTNRHVGQRGSVSQGLIVEYMSKNSITASMRSQGLLIDRPVWIHDGVENWNVIEPNGRDQFQEKLSSVRERMDAKMTINQITSLDMARMSIDKGKHLTVRQREALNIAKERGYYRWPREASAVELAAELGISKTTYLEHLRKAEEKILTPTIK